MRLEHRFEVFTRTLGVQVQDSAPLLATGDPGEAFRFCRAAMKRAEGTLAVPAIRDVLAGKEYAGLEVFQFANEFTLRYID